MKKCKHQVIYALLVGLFWQAPVRAKDVKSSKPWEKNIPESKDDLLSIQNKLQSTLKKAKGAVVAIQSGEGTGSGVIVSKDGLVLTAGHISGRAGQSVKVVLPDGRKVDAVTMGGSEISDSGIFNSLAI